MPTQANNDSGVFDDSYLWDDANVLPLVEEMALWVPVATPKSDTWNLLMPDQREYAIHGSAMAMIIFLELCFSANGYGQQTASKNRLAHYILGLRKVLQEELESANRKQLVNTTWKPYCLTQWAVRVKHGFYHSPQGRKAYQEHCARQNLQLYQHDNPLLYGKF